VPVSPAPRGFPPVPAGAALLVFVCALLASCGGKGEENPVIPPVTSPLSRPVIGYGVINVSYTHVNAEPGEGASSPGYLRRGSLVRIIERRRVKIDKRTESWVLAEGAYRGWLKEEVVDVYDNEFQAKTAAESMTQ
jgi:hypothetical protein